MHSDFNPLPAAGSPFGWWYGKVERLERNGATAAVTLIFPHFPTNSRWYRLRLGMMVEPWSPVSLENPGKTAPGKITWLSQVPKNCFFSVEP